MPGVTDEALAEVAGVTRALVLAGAQVVCVPHYVTTDDGALPSVWCDAANPYNEKALMCRALENEVYVAAANVAAVDHRSHPHRQDMARRWPPERNALRE